MLGNCDIVRLAAGCRTRAVVAAEAAARAAAIAKKKAARIAATTNTDAATNRAASPIPGIAAAVTDINETEPTTNTGASQELAQIEVEDPLSFKGKAYEIKSIDKTANKVVCERIVGDGPVITLTIEEATHLVNDC